jgi:hypothetical protein
MADERDDQATQVGNQVVPENGDQDTAVQSTHVEDPGEGAEASSEGESPAAAQSAAGSGPDAEGKTEAFYQTAQPSQEQKEAAPTPAPPSSEQRPPASPAAADRQAADQHDPFDEKPHLYALGAFAGAFVFAQILKRITGGGDD